MAKARIGDLVVVEWNDAWMDISETHPRSFADSAPISTAGWLLRTEPVVTVAAEKVGDGEYRAVTHIPPGIVVKITSFSASGGERG